MLMLGRSYFGTRGGGNERRKLKRGDESGNIDAITDRLANFVAK
jgi:hypothetical protein